MVVLDFRETAPAGATRERYDRLAAEAGDGPAPTIYGGNAVGVPGQIAGLAEIQRRFATRPLRELIQPAIALAETGFIVDSHYQGACKEALADFTKWPQLKAQYTHIYETLLGDGTPPKVGEKITRPELATVLQLLADRGTDAFYKGPLGEAAVAAVQAAGGMLTMDDLAAYRVREREPLRGATTTTRSSVCPRPPPAACVSSRR